MLKKIFTPNNNTFSGVEFILRGAKKRRAMAISNAPALAASTAALSANIFVCSAISSTTLTKRTDIDYNA